MSLHRASYHHSLSVQEGQKVWWNSSSTSTHTWQKKPDKFNNNNNHHLRKEQAKTMCRLLLRTQNGKFIKKNNFITIKNYITTITLTKTLKVGMWENWNVLYLLIEIEMSLTHCTLIFG